MKKMNLHKNLSKKAVTTILFLMLFSIFLLPGEEENKIINITYIKEGADTPTAEGAAAPARREAASGKNRSAEEKVHFFSKPAKGMGKKKVKIDGKLDDPVYRHLIPVSGFVQFHPKNGAKPTYKTEVYSFYDKKNIYFAFRCFDKEPGKIHADITPFGEYEDNDEVQIYLDTFSDKRNYDTFAVNARGIKKGKRTVWHANAKITGFGWCAEFKIPFKSLRFPVSTIQHWAVNFERKIFRLNETLYWTKVTRDKMNTLADTFAKLEGIRDIKGGKNIEVFPYAGYRDSYSGDVEDDKFAYGVDVKYGITSNLTLDLTTSPDYSEVESDPFFYQLSPFEVNLDENRPFYSEGSSYFSTYFDLFYSRRISHPTMAAKITGKEKGFSMGVLAARNSYDGVDKFHGVFRLKKDIFKLSNIGMIYSSIEEGDNWNRNLGFDFTFKFKDIYTLLGMAAFAYNKDQPRSDNGLYRLQFLRSVDKGFSLAGLYIRIEPGVHVPAGFVPNIDAQRFIAIGKYSFRWEGKGIEKLSFSIWKVNESTVSSATSYQDYYNFILQILTKSRVNFITGYSFGKLRAKIFNENYDIVLDDKLYPATFFSTELYYSGSRVVQFGGIFAIINDFVYNEDFTGTLDGKFREGQLWANFKISPQLQLRLGYRKVNYRSIDKTIRFNGDLLSSTLNFQAHKKVSSFLKFQYDSDGRRFQYDFLIGYEPANVSKIYLSIKNYSENRFRFLEPDARSITFKISYLLRI